jgi:hypothetical protein
MKRDMDLVRAIALAVEERPTALGGEELEVPDYSKEEVGYHVNLMMEAGLLHGTDITSTADTVPRALPSRLTWEGHEFADAARDRGRWQKAKELAAEKAGTVSVSVLVELLKKLMSDSLGL